jgi:hypothetical protein
MYALASAKRCQQAVHPLLEGYRAQIQHPYAALEVLEAKLGPVGAERREFDHGTRRPAGPTGARGRGEYGTTGEVEVGRLELPQGGV